MAEGSGLFTVAGVGYACGAFLHLLSALLRRAGLSRVATAPVAAGFVAQTAGFVLRGLALGTLPVTNTYETLVFYGWVFALGYLAMLLLGRWKAGRLRGVGGGVAAFAAATIALASSPLYSPELQPLVPALRSHWLILHVSFTLVGEGFFLVAFVASAVTLFRSGGRISQGKARSDVLERLDDLAYRAVAVGFPFFTVGGLFFGAVWAKHAWGRYWGWDPKETFMLVTWLVYVLYLHVRLRRGWRGRRTAWIAVLGFFLALFTFAGVNFLVRGLHSYS